MGHWGIGGHHRRLTGSLARESAQPLIITISRDQRTFWHTGNFFDLVPLRISSCWSGRGGGVLDESEALAPTFLNREESLALFFFFLGVLG